MKEGETVTVTCAPGYIPSSDTTTATCGASGDMQFNDTSFECVDENSKLSQKIQLHITAD